MESVIAKNVKEIIKERGLKQGMVGKKAGYDYRVFSNMLNGRKIVTDVDVAKIANALEIEPGELFATRKAETGKRA